MVMRWCGALGCILVLACGPAQGYVAVSQPQPPGVGRLTPGYHLLVTHPGLDTPELAALVDLHQAQPLANMSRHRQGELDALTAEAFRAALVRRRVTPITYRALLGSVRSTGPTGPRR